MELIELEELSDKLIAEIYYERYTGQKHPTLEQDMTLYWSLIPNYAAVLRKKNELTHKGKVITTPRQFKKACEFEGWTWLIDDAEREVSSNA